MNDLPSIRELVLLRDPRPNDVLVAHIDIRVTEMEARNMREALEREIGCRVLVVGGPIDLTTPRVRRRRWRRS